MVEIEHRRHYRNRRAIGLPSIATFAFAGAAVLTPAHDMITSSASAFQVHRLPQHSPSIGSKLRWQTTSSLHSTPPTAEELVASARQCLEQNDTDTAFAQLARAHATNANAPGLFAAFEEVFRARIRLYNDPIDRLGLGSLLLEREKYSDAAIEFRAVLNDATLTDETSRERAASSLFRCKANVCDWSSYDEDCAALVATVRSSLEASQLPTVHPYEALMWPCLTLSDAARIGARYGARALASVNTALPLPDLSHGASRYQETGKIRIGYLSNDFTGRHPLGFLMQDVFRFHSNEFEVYIYSLMEYDESPEIEKIRASASGGAWRELLGSPYESARTIRADNLDILVDLTIYNGPANEAEILAHRVAPIQISHEGFPATCGCPPLIDYIVCDEITIPAHLQQYYSERKLYMPNCFFVNSHRYLPTNGMNRSVGEGTREQVGLPENGFIYCAHHRSDKIDPRTFRTWLRALTRVPASYLWILSAGDEMEQNLRMIASEEFCLGEDRLVFSEKAPRNDHLLRLRLADLFLDTPAYNAHTTGCDCLVNGIPMVSLLRSIPAGEGEVDTDKMPSRVGASFLHTLGLDELIASDMSAYEDVLVKCATEAQWYSGIRDRLEKNRFSSPLFDTDDWIKTWEAGLKEVVIRDEFEDVYL